MLFVRRLGCSLGTGTYNMTGFLGHEGVEKPQKCQQSLMRWTSWERLTLLLLSCFQQWLSWAHFQKPPHWDVPLGSCTFSGADGEGGLGSTLPKQPSSNLVKEEVSVPARVTLLLLRPSHFNCAALLSRCAASSKSVTPYVKENDMGFKDNDQEALLI